MPKLDNLKRLLEDESDSPNDIDWLDVDMQDYRENEEDLPKQNLDVIPDLQKEWGQRRENDGKFNLFPVNKEPEKKTTPFWSENSKKTGLSEEEKGRIVERFMKRKMMEGYSAENTLEIMKNEFPKQILSSARSRIKKAIKEDGLLGTVYVESEMFTDCNQGGEGMDFVRENAEDAKYVVGKDECHDCIYNKGGVCSQFEKEIVFDVDYGSDVWEFYKKKFEQQGKDLSHIDEDNPPKIKIRNASKASKKDDSDKKLDGKPVKSLPQDDISTEEAWEEISNKEVKSKVVGNVYKERKEKEFAKKMMIEGASREPLNASLEDKLENDPDLSSLSKEANLLGPLYLDLSYFDSRKEAKNFFEENSIPVQERVLTGSPKDSNLKESSDSPLRTKKALSSILNRYSLTNLGPEHEEKKPLLKKIGKRLLNSDKERLRKFAQGVFSEPLPQKKKKYDASGQPLGNLSDNITEEEALEELKSAERDVSEVKEDSSTKSIRNKLAQKMMKTDFHDENIEQAIVSSNKDSISSLEKHLHLLGNLYVDSSYFSNKKAFQNFLKENPSLKDLPDLEGKNVVSFLKQDHIKRKLANWMSQVEKMKISSKEDLSSDNIHELAQKLYSMELPKMSSYVEHDSTSSPSGSEMMEEFEMGENNDPMEGISIKKDHKEEKMEGVSFGGLRIDLNS